MENCYLEYKKTPSICWSHSPGCTSCHSSSYPLLSFPRSSQRGYAWLCGPLNTSRILGIWTASATASLSGICSVVVAGRGMRSRNSGKLAQPPAPALDPAWWRGCMREWDAWGGVWNVGNCTRPSAMCCADHDNEREREREIWVW